MDYSSAVTLGENIRAARISQGLSLRQLARLLDVSPSQVSRWESDSFVPETSTLVAVARQLELRASTLFTLAGMPLPTDLASLPAMLRAEYQLPPDAIAEIQAHIEAVAEKYRHRRSTDDS